MRRRNRSATIGRLRSIIINAPPPASDAPALKATRVTDERVPGALVLHVADCGAVESALVV